MKVVAKIAYMILICFVPAVHAGDALEALQGTWKSDKDGTISELKKDEWWTEKRLAAIQGILGKLTVRYEGKTCFARMDDWERTYKLTVLREEGRTIEFEWEDPELGKQSSKVEIVGDHLWVTQGRSEVFRERFTRVKPKAEQ